jgi:tRNA(Ile)-lysidine synthase
MPAARRPLAFTAESLLRVLHAMPAAHSYVVGFSGGADSTALLHALTKIKSSLGISISAVHINHGLHADSDKWQNHCERFCDRHDVQLSCIKVQLKHRSGKGLEAEARHLRYEAISTLLRDGSTLLTAHHADDQVETLLLNLMRGSGVDGLSAMPEHRLLGDGFLQRPLLGFQNTMLLEYLQENHIEWIDDPSNQYVNQDRNFVRHEVIPLLEKRWPGVNKSLLLTRQAMADARVLLERLADEYLEHNLCHPHVLVITTRLLNDPHLLKLVTRRWTKRSGTNSIPANKLSNFTDQLAKAGSQNNVCMAWDDNLLHLYRQKLWLIEHVGIAPCPIVTWKSGAKEVYLGADVGQLFLTASENPSKTVEFPPGQFLITNRSAINANTIKHKGHHQSLKNLFQAFNIPPWLRDCIPLCQLDGELVAVGDWCFNDSFRTRMAQHGMSLEWHPAHPLLQFVASGAHPERI